MKLTRLAAASGWSSGTARTKTSRIPEPGDVLYRIKRGLAGYVSYLAACEMNKSFSEYVLYEPILRILTARSFVVDCEVECPGISQPRTGDKKRLDFVAVGQGVRFAIEVKWAQTHRMRVANDHKKLRAFQTAAGSSGDRAFLCVFGRESDIGQLVLQPDGFREVGKPVIADLGRTRFGCRVYELAQDKSSRSTPRR